ncbi:MAG: DNA polymerase III subunit gamma/tau [Acetobacter papayae]
MSEDTDAWHEGDEGLPSPEPEGPGLCGDAPSPPPAPVAEPIAPAVSGAPAPYRVLARKYRPTTFDDLIGQEAMVRTLRNAFALGRVAHAFMLTGVRGVGKTTTARIIARALNCTGPDGQGGPTADPCGVCPNCVAILADRHPDVLEMDAASRTGVDDVREIIEATRFRPMQGRMKVFIIDEVHMLSRNAFNALLKTLEEPPAQVTFIFATTELRKVPVTVLSRCQRFDLRRVPQSALAGLFERIAQKEQVRLSDDALALIARAADGSVRDGLSLLDQAIAQGGGAGSDALIGAEVVADMLGLADRQVVFDLLDAALRGQPDVALSLMDAAHARGADAGLVLGDMLELVHTLSRLRAVPSLEHAADMPEAERVRGQEMAGAFSVPVLMRAWQMLLKGMQELDTAPDRRVAADMVLIRLCYVADLPSPEELVRHLSNAARDGAEPRPDQAGRPGGAGPAGLAAPVAGGIASGAQVPGGGAAGSAPSAMAAAPFASGSAGGSAGGGAVASAVTDAQAMPAIEDDRPRLRMVGGTAMAVEALPPVPEPVVEQEPAPPAIPRTWRETVALVRDAREAVLHGHLRHAAHLVSFACGHIVMRLDAGAPPDVPRRLRLVLERVTGIEWQVELSEAPGEPSLGEQGAEVIQFRRKEAASHPLVQAILEAFPDAELGEVSEHGLDDYGLPPEELHTALAADDPSLMFAPLDAELLDEDERPHDPGLSPD